MCLRQNRWMGGFAACLAVLRAPYSGIDGCQDKTKMEELGKQLFFDRNLSDRRAIVRRVPRTGGGFTGLILNSTRPDGLSGAVHSRFGNRKPPASRMRGEPGLEVRQPQGGWVGGMFWDGRATGARW